MKRWLAAIPLVALIALVGIAINRLNAEDPNKSSFASPERPVPEIELTTLDDTTFDFATNDQVSLVNFWATWCTPCRAEHPLLIELAEQGVRIIGVQYKDEPDLGRTLLEREGNPFSVNAMDPTGDAGIAFGIAGVPETFLVNADGKIIKSLRAPLNAQNTAEFLQAYNQAVANTAQATQN